MVTASCMQRTVQVRKENAYFATIIFTICTFRALGVKSPPPEGPWDRRLHFDLVDVSIVLRSCMWLYISCMCLSIAIVWFTCLYIIVYSYSWLYFGCCATRLHAQLSQNLRFLSPAGLRCDTPWAAGLANLSSCLHIYIYMYIYIYTYIYIYMCKYMYK